MSSCFFSSRLKIRISPKPTLAAMSTTALPKVPVPPVIRRVFPANMLESILLAHFLPSKPFAASNPPGGIAPLTFQISSATLDGCGISVKAKAGEAFAARLKRRALARLFAWATSSYIR